MSSLESRFLEVLKTLYFRYRIKVVPTDSLVDKAKSFIGENGELTIPLETYPFEYVSKLTDKTLFRGWLDRMGIPSAILILV